MIKILGILEKQFRQILTLYLVFRIIQHFRYFAFYNLLFYKENTKNLYCKSLCVMYVAVVAHLLLQLCSYYNIVLGMVLRLHPVVSLSGCYRCPFETSRPAHPATL
jgi:hypothetical protein